MDNDPKLPVAISYVGSSYLIFDIEAVTWIRRTYHMCGVMTGTLPQSPSQNLFLGLPVQIMPEEAQLLVEKGVAYIVDDVKAHTQTLQESDSAAHSAYMAQVRKKGELVSRARFEEREEARLRTLEKSVSGKKKSKPQAKKESATSEPQISNEIADNQDLSLSQIGADDEPHLFDSPISAKPNPPNPKKQLDPHGIVPTTSELWLPSRSDNPSPAESMALLPNVPPSYHLYKHLNSKAYFMTPGLRFGCQYCVYPGDPLRFHSHFLAVGKQWNEEIDLMSIVGGGRLGTGVKKGFLIGGLEPLTVEKNADEEQLEGRVRTFSIEWAAM